VLGVPQPEGLPRSAYVELDVLGAARVDVEDAPAAHADVWRTIGGWLARARERAAEDPSGGWALVGFYY
jgi:hypothetical protein